MLNYYTAIVIVYLRRHATSSLSSVSDFFLKLIAKNGEKRMKKQNFFFELKETRRSKKNRNYKEKKFRDENEKIKHNFYSSECCVTQEIVNFVIFL